MLAHDVGYARGMVRGCGRGAEAEAPRDTGERVPHAARLEPEARLVHGKLGNQADVRQEHGGSDRSGM